MIECLPFLVSEEIKIHRYQFWQAVWIWNTRPNIINRNLCSVNVLHTFVYKSFITSIEKEIDKIISTIFISNKSCGFEDIVIDYLMSYKSIQTCPESETKHICDKSYVIVRRLLFKNDNYIDPFELCFINYAANEIIYYKITDCVERNKIHPSVVSFSLHFCDDKINLKIINENGVQYNWLKHLLLPKLIKWAKDAEPKENFEEHNTGSLKLIRCDKYNELYLQLKNKYGKSFIAKWPENTDPVKFVYEDIAIATYLCLLWSNQKVNFVDLGCGNGLLVHILSEENHKGFGIDIRHRKVWSLYTSSTILKVGTITPESNCFFPEVDWIIGNHSDELTPWIPIFAAKSSYKCNFFLLPCCAYNLNGQRYQRINSAVSVYCDYIEYVKTLTIELGFNVNIDKLRIPSTKRICLIGCERIYDEKTYNEVFREKIEIIQNDYFIGIQRNNMSELNFTPRESKEKVRNCTQIDKIIVSNILEKISKAIIDRQLRLFQEISDPIFDIWSSDYAINFREAISLLENQDLKILKHECGGLQTLLKNNHSVFLIRNNKIYFRKPVEKDVKVHKRKNRPCWFYHNHPLSCPLLENKCSFIH